MKKIKIILRSTLGFCMAGVIINTAWGIFVNMFGIEGGWISALVLTGTLWYINHHLGIVENKKEAVFIDMGLAIGLCSLVRDSLLNGVTGLVSSIPTLLCVLTGGIISGILGGYFQKSANRQGENK